MSIVYCALLDSNPIINGSQNTVGETITSTTTGTSDIGMPVLKLSSITIYLSMFVLAYWFFIRPHKKRQEKLFDFQSKLQPGDEIITSSGLHGKIIEVHDKTFLIEFGVNKGIRLHIDKNHIISYDESERIQD